MVLLAFYIIPTRIPGIAHLNHNYVQFFICKMLANLGFMVTLNCPLLPDYVTKQSLGTGGAILGLFAGFG